MKNFARIAFAFILLASSGFTSAAIADTAATASRPAQWAQAVKKNGLPNFFQITPNFFRGAQPKAAGAQEIENLGIKTVVSLRAFHDDVKQLPKGNFEQVSIRFKTWHAEDEDVIKFLKIVTDPARGPVMVHCLHGSDRTGTMVAVYRLAVEGWSKDDAITEMVNGGYGYHPMWKNLKRYLRNLDVEKIKREAGLSA